MEVVESILNKLRNVRSDMKEIAIEVIQDNAEVIQDLNIAQLQEGERADGETLPDYSPVSVAKFGKPPGPIKLFDKGNFYRGIKTQVFENKFENIGTDSKTAELVGRYGKEILGVQDDNLAIFQENYFLPQMIEKVEKRLT